jgi:hypothetical protein
MEFHNSNENGLNYLSLYLDALNETQYERSVREFAVQKKLTLIKDLVTVNAKHEELYMDFFANRKP